MTDSMILCTNAVYENLQFSRPLYKGTSISTSAGGLYQRDDISRALPTG